MQSHVQRKLWGYSMISIRTIAVAGALVVASSGAARAQQEIDMSPSTPAAQPAAAPTGDDAAFHKGTMGFAFPFTLVSTIAGSVQGGATAVPTIDFVYFLSDKAAVDLIAGVNFHRTQQLQADGSTADSNVFGFAAGVGYRLYSSKNSLRSYLEPQAVLVWPNTSISDTFALDLGVAFGLERNVTPWFSVSGAIGARLDFADSFKDIQLATDASLAANLYWK
jgi:hypothetical protein